jgi:hypothetical protein
MIKKKSQAYALIRDNIAMLSTMQEAMDYSPSRLAFMFVMLETDDNNERTEVMTNTKTFYKYFNSQLRGYRKNESESEARSTMLRLFKRDYLTSTDYVGISYIELYEDYRKQESLLKDFVKDFYKTTLPITTDMSASEKGTRNQFIGKISVKCCVGDVVGYSYFNEAPNFMIKNIEDDLLSIDTLIQRFLIDTKLRNRFADSREVSLRRGIQHDGNKSNQPFKKTKWRMHENT